VDSMTDLQTKLHEWRQRNFPDSSAMQQLLGVVEEVGELAHVVLKREQGIRGMSDLQAQDLILDAVGDIQIFLAGFCSYEDISMEIAYRQTAEEVMKRDWVRFPDTGFPDPGSAEG
jgi:NTP pyrophosphatase (non-canonical NTP hydrolase)